MNRHEVLPQKPLKFESNGNSRRNVIFYPKFKCKLAENRVQLHIFTVYFDECHNLADFPWQPHACLCQFASSRPFWKLIPTVNQRYLKIISSLFLGYANILAEPETDIRWLAMSNRVTEKLRTTDNGRRTTASDYVPYTNIKMISKPFLRLLPPKRIKILILTIANFWPISIL